MSAKPRDLMKTRAQRIGEVYTHIHHKSGAFDVQLVSFGGDLSVNGGATDTFDISAFEAVINGAIVNVAAKTAVVPGASTGTGEFRKVLIMSDKNGTITQKAGAVAASQDEALKPRPDVDKIELGWLELPASFTADTTALTLGMLKKTPYWGS